MKYNTIEFISFQIEILDFTTTSWSSWKDSWRMTSEITPPGITDSLSSLIRSNHWVSRHFWVVKSNWIKRHIVHWNNCNANSDNGLVSECSPNTEAEQVSNSVEKKRLVAGGNEEQQQNRDQLKVCVQSRSHAILGEKLFSSLSLIIFNLRRIQVF